MAFMLRTRTYRSIVNTRLLVLFGIWLVGESHTLTALVSMMHHFGKCNCCDSTPLAPASLVLSCLRSYHSTRLDMWITFLTLLRTTFDDLMLHVWQTHPDFALHQRGQGAPAREPVVSQDDQKHMMAYYYKKQEEFKVRTFFLTLSIHQDYHTHC